MQRFLLVLSFIFIAIITMLLAIQYASKDVTRIEEKINSNLSKIAKDQEADLNEFVDQLSIYSNPFDIYSNGAFKKRVFIGEKLVYWSDNELLGSYADFAKDSSLFLYSLEKDYYIVQKEEVLNQNLAIEIYSFLPLLIDPPIKNQHLKEEYNQAIFEAYKVRFNRGNQKLKLGDLSVPIEIAEQPYYKLDSWVAGLSFIAALFLLWSLFLRLEGKSKLKRALLILVGAIGIRLFFWIITHYFINVPLFDAIHYTSKYGSSLGDLFLNSLFVYLLLYLSLKERSPRTGSKLQWLNLAFLLLLLHISAYLLFKICWNLLNNSLIILDIGESIQFDLTRLIAYFILLIWGVIHFRVFRVVLSSIKLFDGHRWQVGVAYLVVMAAMALVIQDEKIVLCFLMQGGLFGILFFFRFDFQLDNLDYRSFLYVSFLVAFIASVFTLAVYEYFEKAELISKKRFANRLLIKNDFLGEYFLNEKISDIQNDTYIRTRLGNPLLSSSYIDDKIKRQYLSSYFDKYEVEVDLFDASGHSLVEGSDHYDSLRSKLNFPEYKTDYPNIYFVQDTEGQIQDRYHCFIPVTSFDQPVGYVLLSLTLKKYIPKSVFPQLMVESRYYFTDENKFDYAVYKDGKLLYKRGRFEFGGLLDYPTLSNPILYLNGLEVGEKHFYGFKTTDDKRYVIASDVYSSSYLISNFSFFYLLILFCFALIFALRNLFITNKTFNLSSKIQLYLALSLIVPMLIVSIALLNTLNESYKEEIDKSFSKKAYNISEYLLSASEQFFNNDINRDDLNNVVSEVSSLLQSDINLYSAEGQLVVSSEPEIFNMGLLGKQIAPQPFNAIKYAFSENKVYKQSIGDLSFRVSYVGLRSHKDGKLLGILSLPYFNSKNHLRRQQVEVFNNLISIFTVIFILSVIFGNLAIEQLIRPLKLITERLKLTDLKEVNEPIAYTSADEIGLLINEYNLMIAKLEESKAALAASQKESAWKEIARQVAHEIKNPLTPMRLKIQQMMRQMGSESREYNTLNSLIGQIDALSSIADSFSAFARMPAPKNDRFDLSQLITSVVEVHRREDVTIDSSSVSEGVFVFADIKIFSGIMNNIILNAIQASESGNTMIFVSLDVRPKKVIIEIRDNGSGIEESDREKIFTPYFSTKTSGSGIGLAVAKKGIENAGGNIWFESKVGEGTTFFISLPIVG
ncbi:MAG: HAMP domain-containing histidine kinase [Cyclobacteriaceae bacterium]